MPSLRLLAARSFVRWMSDAALSSERLRARFAQRAYPRHAAPTRRALRLTQLSEREHRGRPLFELSPRGAESAWHIIYLHGGGFVKPIHWAHWDICASLVQATGASLSLPTYPLCPEHSLDECYEHLESLYERVLTERSTRRLLICGDSAGGNLALSLALRRRDAGLSLPERVTLFCPWLDLSMSEPAIQALVPLDPMLQLSTIEEWGRWWAGERALQDPSVSPLYADLEGLPPIDQYLGTHDLLTPDAQRLTRRLREAEVEVNEQLTEGGFHVFMGATFTPEARRVYQRIAGQLSSVSAG
jgi:monoterpene epsilon-lactone hydrolase